MPTPGYEDQRFSLRPPVLAVCFFFGVFMGFYLASLRLVPTSPPGDGISPPLPTQRGPLGEATQPADSAQPAETPPGSGVAEVAPAPAAVAEANSDEGVIDLGSMPPEPPVVLSPLVGLTSLNASPPVFADPAAPDFGTSAAGAAQPPERGEQPPRRTPDQLRRSFDALMP